MKNYFSIILFVLIELIFSNNNVYGQCATACGSNLINNPGFETATPLCTTSTDNQLYHTTTPVANWSGTDDTGASTPDYASPCAASTGTANLPCLIGSARVGIFTVFGTSNTREYVQSQLSSPLIAGHTYCYSMVVKSRVGTLGNVTTTCDGIGAWFHNQGKINIQTMNAAQQFLGPGSTINASPQVQNTAGNLIGASCVTVTGTFCALGGESWIVIGNFRNDANTVMTGSGSNYMYIDETKLFDICSTCVLPISLVNFSASCINNNNNIKIEWATASETNNKEFIIERSYDGLNFNAIHTQQGSGNSYVMNNYYYIDNNFGSIINKTIYYRLKQLDYDGAIHYYNVISPVNCENLSTELILYPNPSSGGFQILNSTIDQIVYVFDDIGQLVYSKKIITENEFLNISELSNGLYIIKILDVNGNYFEKKLIKNDEIIFDNKWDKY